MPTAEGHAHKEPGFNWRAASYIAFGTLSLLAVGSFVAACFLFPPTLAAIPFIGKVATTAGVSVAGVGSFIKAHLSRKKKKEVAPMQQEQRQEQRQAVTVHFGTRPEPDEVAQLKAALAAQADVTERKQAELDRANARLEKRCKQLITEHEDRMHHFQAALVMIIKDPTLNTIRMAKIKHPFIDQEETLEPEAATLFLDKQGEGAQKSQKPEILERHYTTAAEKIKQADKGIRQIASTVSQTKNITNKMGSYDQLLELTQTCLNGIRQFFASIIRNVKTKKVKDSLIKSQCDELLRALPERIRRSEVSLPPTAFFSPAGAPGKTDRPPPSPSAPRGALAL